MQGTNCTQYLLYTVILNRPSVAKCEKQMIYVISLVYNCVLGVDDVVLCSEF